MDIEALNDALGSGSVDGSIFRPAIRYHGGKFRIAQWIIKHFPPHVTYVEPYGGAASVLCLKPRCRDEIYNDLDDAVVQMFMVLRDPKQRRQLIEALTFSPYSRSEFNAAWEDTSDPIERSRRLIIRAEMGFSSAGSTGGATGFTIDIKRNRSTRQSVWMKVPDNLAAVGRRFEGVLVENRPALEVMRYYDDSDTLFYVDPPYAPQTRCIYRAYHHEMSEADHIEMLNVMCGLDGMVVLSGYPSALYSDALPHWEQVSVSASASGHRGTTIRSECLWINPAAMANSCVQQSLL